MHPLKNTLDAFLTGDLNVLVIKGAWGVGKTYFWDDYITKRIEEKDLTQVAYSYISLFGHYSLEDLRKRVFHSTKSVSDDNRIDESFKQESIEASSFLSKVPWIKGALTKAQKRTSSINHVSKYLQYLPAIGKFSGMISTMEYALVKNYIICIDDIERKAKELSIADVMGLVDELAQRKSCKMVLIFNENELSDDDKEQFEKYREKVVDLEISYNPTSRENLAHIFSAETFHRYDVLEDTVCKLDIKNIRILRNIKNIFDVFYPFIEGKDVQIIDEFILHAVLLCRYYYDKDKDLTYDILKDELSGNHYRFLFKKDKDISPGQKEYKELAQMLKIRTSLFDDHISFFLEHGYLENEDTLKKVIIQLEEDIKVNSVKSKIDRAWAIYADSFEDNYEEFKLAMVGILDSEMERLELNTFGEILGTLDDLGESIDSYIDRYIEQNREKLYISKTEQTMRYGLHKCQKLVNRIKELNNAEKIFNIDEILLRIANTSSWNTEDQDYLESLSVTDYKEWMKSNPNNMTDKIREGLLKFGGKVSRDATEALKLIASEPSTNNFNAFRIKNIYKIE